MLTLLLKAKYISKKMIGGKLVYTYKKGGSKIPSHLGEQAMRGGDLSSKSRKELGAMVNAGANTDSGKSARAELTRRLKENGGKTTNANVPKISSIQALNRVDVAICMVKEL